MLFPPPTAGPATRFGDRALRGDLLVSPRRLQPLSALRGNTTQEKAAAVARSEEARGGEVQGARQPQPGTTLRVTSLGPASQGVRGSQGVPLSLQPGGCRAGTGGLSTRVSFRHSWEPPKTPVKGPAVLTCPRAAQLRPTKLPLERNRSSLAVRARSPRAGPPPPGALCTLVRWGSPPRCQQRTYVPFCHGRWEMPGSGTDTFLQGWAVYHPDSRTEKRGDPPPQNQRHVRGVREARKHRRG